MRRNQCKKWVLTALSDMTEPVKPSIVKVWLESMYNVELTDRAVSMELLRCSRMKLARRKDGKYWLREKGQERLNWLRAQQ